jgi:hypothetical protein
MLPSFIDFITTPLAIVAHFPSSVLSARIFLAILSGCPERCEDLLVMRANNVLVLYHSKAHRLGQPSRFSFNVHL